jgi:SnoaL-like domain
MASDSDERLARLEQRVRELEDIQLIERLKYRYAGYCDDGYNPDGIASLFVEDGRWIVDGVGGHNENREEIRAHFAALSGAIPWAQHYMINPAITVAADGQSAVGKFHLLCVATIVRTNAPAEFDAVVLTIQYTDTFVKMDGEWLFQELLGRTHHVSDWTEGWVRQPMRP